MKKSIPCLTAENTPTTNQSLVKAIRELVECMDGSRSIEEPPSVISTGVLALDRRLPLGGLRAGSVSEWHSMEIDGGAGLLALLAAREACYEGGALVVVDRSEAFYAPAAAALGIDLEKVILVRPAKAADEAGAIESALRCTGVAAVWGTVSALDETAIDRIELAAVQSGALALLVRTGADETPFAEEAFLVEPRPASYGRRVRVERIADGREGAAVELEIDEISGFVREAAAPRRFLCGCGS